VRIIHSIIVPSFKKISTVIAIFSRRTSSFTFTYDSSVRTNLNAIECSRNICNCGDRRWKGELDLPVSSTSTIAITMTMTIVMTIISRIETTMSPSPPVLRLTFDFLTISTTDRQKTATQRLSALKFQLFDPGLDPFITFVISELKRPPFVRLLQSVYIVHVLL